MKRRPRARITHQARVGNRRAQVLALVQRGVGTVAALAHELRLTDNAVRSHLLALERRRLIARKGLQPGRRRPHELYQLTPRAERLLAHASDVALSAILTALKESCSATELRNLLEKGGAVLAARLDTGNRTVSLERRVRRAVRLLESLGGAPEMEKTKAGFCVRSQACPLAAVVVEHPETCQLVENFLARVIRARVSEHCLRNGKSQCRFVVQADEG